MTEDRAGQPSTSALARALREGDTQERNAPQKQDAKSQSDCLKEGQANIVGAEEEIVLGIACKHPKAQKTRKLRRLDDEAQPPPPKKIQRVVTPQQHVEESRLRQQRINQITRPVGQSFVREVMGWECEGGILTKRSGALPAKEVKRGRGGPRGEDDQVDSAAEGAGDQGRDMPMSQLQRRDYEEDDVEPLEVLVKGRINDMTHAEKRGWRTCGRKGDTVRERTLWTQELSTQFDAPCTSAAPRSTRAGSKARSNRIRFLVTRRFSSRWLPRC